MGGADAWRRTARGGPSGGFRTGFGFFTNPERFGDGAAVASNLDGSGRAGEGGAGPSGGRHRHPRRLLQRAGRRPAGPGPVKFYDHAAFGNAHQPTAWSPTAAVILDKDGGASLLKGEATMLTSTAMLPSEKPMNLIGRHHAGGSSGVSRVTNDSLGGTSNFTNADGSVFNDTVDSTLRNFKWGRDRFHSLTGNHNIQILP